MSKIEVTFAPVKETKGTWKFEEMGDDPKIGTLYVRKTALAELGWDEDGQSMAELRVTVEA